MSIQHFSVATGVSGPLTAEVVPASWSESFTNGQSPQNKGFEAFATGGTGPYSYSWAFLGAALGLSFVGGTTSKTCTIQASGSDAERSDTLRCTVTDGLSDTAQADVAISVIFGSPP